MQRCCRISQAAWQKAKSREAQKQKSKKQPQRKQINKNNNTHTTVDDGNIYVHMYVCARKKRSLKTIRTKINENRKNRNVKA